MVAPWNALQSDNEFALRLGLLNGLSFGQFFLHDLLHALARTRMVAWLGQFEAGCTLDAFDHLGHRKCGGFFDLAQHHARRLLEGLVTQFQPPKHQADKGNCQ
jgi:hypothetical protein